MERPQKETILSQEAVETICQALRHLISQESFDKLVSLSPERKLCIIETLIHVVENDVATVYEMFGGEARVKPPVIGVIQKLEPRQIKTNLFD